MMNVPVNKTHVAAHTQPDELLVPHSLAVIYKYCTYLLKVHKHLFAATATYRSVKALHIQCLKEILHQMLIHFHIPTLVNKGRKKEKRMNHICTLSPRTFHECIKMCPSTCYFSFAHESTDPFLCVFLRLGFLLLSN